MQQIDTSRQLEWLKGVKDSHGSVAMSSFMQAEAINARGVYEVGCLQQRKASGNGEETLESAIRLTVPPKEGDKETKVYNLDELKDLQSKLMLIAAKASHGKEEVDMFVEVGLQGCLWLFMKFYLTMLITTEYSTCNKYIPLINRVRGPYCKLWILVFLLALLYGPQARTARPIKRGGENRGSITYGTDQANEVNNKMFIIWL